VSFLCGYLKLLQNIKTTPTDQILHGKQPMIDASDVRAASQAKLPPDKSWCRPPAGWVTLTIDGSFKEVDGNGGSGMVLRDEVGHIIFSACHFLPSCVEAMEAELSACLEGLHLAIQQSQLPILVETDYSLLVAAVRETAQDRSIYMHIITEIKELVRQDRICSFVKVDRQQVRASH
jgi:ribonuclease HI